MESLCCLSNVCFGQNSEGMRIWNKLMIEEHPLGDGPLVGRQLRYLISSEHGWLGGFGFAAPPCNYQIVIIGLAGIKSNVKLTCILS